MRFGNESVVIDGRSESGTGARKGLSLTANSQSMAQQHRMLGMEKRIEDANEGWDQDVMGWDGPSESWKALTRRTRMRFRHFGMHKCNSMSTKGLWMHLVPLTASRRMDARTRMKTQNRAVHRWPFLLLLRILGRRINSKSARTAWTEN